MIIAFLASMFGAGFLFYFAAFKLKNSRSPKANFMIAVLLSLGTLPVALGLFEILFFNLDRFKETRKTFPEAPQIISRYKTQPHVRVKDSILYLAPTNQIFRTFGHEYKTNGMGFRERSFTFQKTPKTFRILVFGDSLTFGVAVANEQRYTNLLETILNMTYKNNPSVENDRVEILNFGVPGYSLDQERDLMSAILKHVECDLVVVGIISDDLNMTTRYSLRGFTINKGRDAVPIPVYKNPERTFQTISETEPDSFSKPARWQENLSLYQLLESRTGWFSSNALPTTDRWNYALNEFSNMKAITQQYKLPPPVIALLHYGGVNPNDNDFFSPKGKLAENIEILGFIGGELETRGFHVADTLPMFRDFNRMALAVSEWEWHPNYLGHYVYAQTLVKFLWDKNLLQ